MNGEATGAGERPHYGLYVGGAWRAPRGGRRLDAVNPYTGQVWATISDAAPEDVRDAAAVAREAYESVWSKVNGAERARLMNHLADLLQADAARMGRLESTDNGKIIRETQPQMVFAARQYRFFAGYADKLFGKQIPLDSRDAFDFTTQEPYGVVGLITAWNSVRAEGVHPADDVDGLAQGARPRGRCHSVPVCRAVSRPLSSRTTVDLRETMTRHDEVLDERAHDALLDAVSEATRSVRLSSPYLGAGVATTLACIAGRSDATWQVLTDLNAAAVAHGSLSTAGLRALLHKGVSLRHRGRLHAKLYLCDESFGLVGSANLTAAGLGSGDQANVELSLQLQPFRTRREAVYVFDAWWKKGQVITEEEIEQVELAAASLPASVHVASATKPHSTTSELPAHCAKRKR